MEKTPAEFIQASPAIKRGEKKCFVKVVAIGDSGVGIIRAPGYYNLDLSISKRFATIGNQYFLFRGEMFNALNHPNFGPPNRDIQSTAFGTITSVVGDARIVQLVAKYYF